MFVVLQIKVAAGCVVMGAQVWLYLITYQWQLPQRERRWRQYLATGVQWTVLLGVHFHQHEWLAVTMTTGFWGG